MKLVEDLGTRIVGSQGYKKSFGVYECPVCHEHFECITADVKSGHTTKCRNCADKARNKARAAKASKEFVGKAVAIHDENCNYSLVDYVNAKTKVELGCNICNNSFWQRPDDHLHGQGCPHCAREKRDIALRMSESNTKPTTLYYIYFPEVNLWKVGCTSKTITERFSQEKLKYTIIQTKEYTSGNKAYRVEKFILDATKAYQFKGKVLGKGNTELRIQQIDNILELIAEAEASFATTT